jgi:hypothetical protein
MKNGMTERHWTMTLELTEEERHHLLGIMNGREPRLDACPKCIAIAAKLRPSATAEPYPSGGNTDGDNHE